MIYKWIEKRLSIKEKGTTDSQILQEGKQGSITGDMTHTSRLSRFIDKFGLITLGKFLKDSLFTTKMKIPSIMMSQTSNSWRNPSIVDYMDHAQKSLDSQYEILKKHAKERQNGTLLLKQKNGRRNETPKDNSSKN